MIPWPTEQWGIDMNGDIHFKVPSMGSLIWTHWEIGVHTTVWVQIQKCVLSTLLSVALTRVYKKQAEFVKFQITMWMKLKYHKTCYFVITLTQ